jgi:hypothetical protein
MDDEARGAAIRAVPATGDDAMRGVDRGKMSKTACAALAAAVILAGTASWAGDGAGSEPVGSCQAGAEMGDMNGQVAEIIHQLVERERQNPREDSGLVVLNNRGYNYGPPPSVRFDPIGLERAPADPHAQ